MCVRNPVETLSVARAAGGGSQAQLGSAFKPLWFLEGSIGAGKSTVAKALARTLGFRVLSEPVDHALLEAFYADVHGMAFTFQMAMLHARYAIHRAATAEVCLCSGDEDDPTLECGCGGVVLDRSLWGDLCFARLLASQGDITPVQLRVYMNAVRNMSSALFPPTRLIFLDVSPIECYARIARRGRPQESGITLEYLEAIDAQYRRLIQECAESFWPWSNTVKLTRVSEVALRRVSPGDDAAMTQCVLDAIDRDETACPR